MSLLIWLAIGAVIMVFVILVIAAYPRDNSF